MNLRLVIRPEARADMIEAAMWYEEKQTGLGADFSQEVLNAINSLDAKASLYRVRARCRCHEVRWLYPERFPYRVMYFVEAGTVTVFAVIHAKRHHAAWNERP